MFFFIPALIGIATALGTATAAAGTVIVATSAITLGTMAGVAITVGGLATTALASAAVFGIASSLIEDTNTGSSEYISSSQRNYEKSKLEKTLVEERQWLINIKNSTNDSELINEIDTVLGEVENFRKQDEYYKAINHIKNYKLTYAKHINNQEVANEVERIAKKLIQIREESKNL